MKNGDAFRRATLAMATLCFANVAMAQNENIDDENKLSKSTPGVTEKFVTEGPVDYREYYNYLLKLNPELKSSHIKKGDPLYKLGVLPSGEYRVARTWDWIKLGAATAANLPSKDRTTVVYVYNMSDLKDTLKNHDTNELYQWGLAIPNGDSFSVIGASSPKYFRFVQNWKDGGFSMMKQELEATGGFIVSKADHINGISPIKELINYDSSK